MGQYIQDKKTGQMKGMIGDGKTQLPTAADTAVAMSQHKVDYTPYPSGASREVLDEWQANLRASQESSRAAHNAWRAENYPADVRGSGLDYPFTQESEIIRAYKAVNGETSYSYPETAFKSKEAEAVIRAEHQKAADELVESGLAEMDDQGVWRVEACESVGFGYNHTTKVLKAEYESLPPLHKFVIAHATDSFGASLTGRNFRISGND